MGAGWSWLIPMQPPRKRLKRTTHGSNLVTVKLLSKRFVSPRAIGRIQGDPIFSSKREVKIQVKKL